MRAPSITTSTADERRSYVRERYVCISNCDLCGICATFHGRDVEQALQDYIDGHAELREVLKRYR